MTQLIDLHIERLVLSGVSEADGQQIGAELQRALQDLLTQRGVPAALSAGAAIPYLDAGGYRVEPGAAPASIGAGAANQIYEGWNK